MSRRIGMLQFLKLPEGTRVSRNKISPTFHVVTFEGRIELFFLTTFA